MKTGNPFVLNPKGSDIYFWGGYKSPTHSPIPRSSLLAIAFAVSITDCYDALIGSLMPSTDSLMSIISFLMSLFSFVLSINASLMSLFLFVMSIFSFVLS